MKRIVAPQIGEESNNMKRKGKDREKESTNKKREKNGAKVELKPHFIFILCFF
jgi:hypothetical protein